jgi:hypothetical protein
LNLRAKRRSRVGSKRLKLAKRDARKQSRGSKMEIASDIDLPLLGMMKSLAKECKVHEIAVLI